MSTGSQLSGIQIAPDWLLIYYVSSEVLRLEATETHADLFD